MGRISFLRKTHVRKTLESQVDRRDMPTVDHSHRCQVETRELARSAHHSISPLTLELTIYS